MQSSLSLSIGLVGSVASVIALLIAAPGMKSKFIHLAYAVFITALAAVTFWSQEQLNETRRIEKQAEARLSIALAICCKMHRVDMVGKPDLDRYCWLKGDLSFETIRQAVIEPADRVWIGDVPPVGPSPSETLRHITVTRCAVDSYTLSAAKFRPHHDHRRTGFSIDQFKVGESATLGH